MTEQERMEILDEMVRRIVARFHPDRIILSGSYAKGTPTADSDLDILIVMPVEGSRRGKANEIDLALSDRTIPIDIIVVTLDQFERQRDVIGTIVRAAAQEGRTVYERAA
jgi:predicted nucleotidyltransferase